MQKTTMLGATLALAIVAATGHDVAANGARADADVVLKWNQLLQNTLPPSGNPLTPRFYPMMHIAMFDAINAIERDFEPYRVRMRSRVGGSASAAAAQAAHDALVALNPVAVPTYDAAPRSLANSLQATCGAALKLAPRWPGRFSRGGRRTAGSSRYFRLRRATVAWTLAAGKGGGKRPPDLLSFPAKTTVTATILSSELPASSTRPA